MSQSTLRGVLDCTVSEPTAHDPVRLGRGLVLLHRSDRPSVYHGIIIFAHRQSSKEGESTVADRRE